MLIEDKYTNFLDEKPTIHNMNRLILDIFLFIQDILLVNRIH